MLRGTADQMRAISATLSAQSQKKLCPKDNRHRKPCEISVCLVSTYRKNTLQVLP